MGCVADRELREETVMYLQSESKETPVIAAKDQRHLTKGRGINTRDVVGLGKERERLDAKIGRAHV